MVRNDRLVIAALNSSYPILFTVFDLESFSFARCWLSSSIEVGGSATSDNIVELMYSGVVFDVGKVESRRCASCLGNCANADLQNFRVQRKMWLYHFTLCA